MWTFKKERERTRLQENDNKITILLRRALKGCTKKVYKSLPPLETFPSSVILLLTLLLRVEEWEEEKKKRIGGRERKMRKRKAGGEMSCTFYWCVWGIGCGMLSFLLCESKTKCLLVACTYDDRVTPHYHVFPFLSFRQIDKATRNPTPLISVDRSKRETDLLAFDIHFIHFIHIISVSQNRKSLRIYARANVWMVSKCLDSKCSLATFFS